MKKVILSADDFGRSNERNMAIDHAFKQGLIKSAGLIVNTKYTEEAVNMAVAGGYLSLLHCHFNTSSNIHSGGGGLPVSENMSKDTIWCKDGKFRDTVKHSCDILFIHSNVIFGELEAQFQKFVDITRGEANNTHVDFHLYHNLHLSTAWALRKFINHHDIQSARYIGIEKQHNIKLVTRLRQIISLNILKTAKIKNPLTKNIKSSNINYFLRKPEVMNTDIIELYCHPDCIDGELMDNSISVFGDQIMSLKEHIAAINRTCKCEFLSWKDISI